MLKKLMKTTEGLDAEIQALTEKAVAKAMADFKRHAKMRIAAAIAASKGAGHPKEVKMALVSTLNQLKTELTS